MMIKPLFRKKQRCFLFLLALLFAAFLLIYGCGGEWRGLENFGGAAGTLTLNPVSVDFGFISVGDSRASTITIYNEGPEDLSISDMSLTDIENFDLDINGGGSPCGSTNLTIPAGECRTVAVIFSPYSVDTCSASLTIDSDSPDAQRISVSLMGKGMGPDIAVSPTNHSFGTIEMGSESDPVEISITNLGTDDLYISEIFLTDTDSYFLDLNGGQYPAGSTEIAIPPGQTRTVTIAFDPVTPGTFAGELHIVSNDPGNGTASIVLSGIGQEVALPDRTVTLAWESPDTNLDGTPVTEIDGFKIYFGPSSGNYTDLIEVGYIFIYTFEDLPPGTLYFSVTSYDTMGNESTFSNEVSKTFN